MGCLVFKRELTVWLRKGDPVVKEPSQSSQKPSETNQFCLRRRGVAKTTLESSISCTQNGQRVEACRTNFRFFFPGVGGFRLNLHIEVSFKWMWFPIGIFQSLYFSLREGSKKKFDTASSRGFTIAAYQRFDGQIWHHNDDVRGRKDRRRYRRLSAICCPQKRLTWRQLLKLQSRAAGEKNPQRKRRTWRGRSTASPVQRSTMAGAILFGDANRVHNHLKPTSMRRITLKVRTLTATVAACPAEIASVRSTKTTEASLCVCTVLRRNVARMGAQGTLVDICREWVKA